MTQRFRIRFARPRLDGAIGTLIVTEAQAPCHLPKPP